MIVTFHLVVYLYTRLWNNYIAVLFRNDRDVSDNNHDPDNNTNISKISGTTVIETGPANESLNENQSNLTSTNINVTFGNNSPISRVKGRSEEDIIEDEGQSSSEYCGDKDETSGSVKNESTYFVCKISKENKMTFIPPVFVQRYMVIQSILKKPPWNNDIKKVVDFGCAELKFELKYLKKLFGIQEIIAVDIDEQLLDICSSTIRPTVTDHLQPRSTPLTIRVFSGSVANTHEVLNNCDAVIAIELIEHLYPRELENLPFTIFGYIRPKVAIFTTPNADFNVLFPNFSGFRHDDHKFEWSRQQFKDWGNNLVQRYPDYTVTFKGIGRGPSGMKDLGCCSQMAIFVKVNNSSPVNNDELHIQDGNYKLIREHEYPFFKDVRTREQKLKDDAVNFIHRLCMLRSRYDEDKLSEIPLTTIMERIGCRQMKKLKTLLTEDNWEIRINAQGDEVVVIPDAESDDEDSISDTDEEHIDSEQVYGVYSNNVIDDENWDFDNIDSEVYNPINKHSSVKCSTKPSDENIDSKVLTPIITNSSAKFSSKPSDENIDSKVLTPINTNSSAKFSSKPSDENIDSKAHTPINTNSSAKCSSKPSDENITMSKDRSCVLSDSKETERTSDGLLDVSYSEMCSMPKEAVPVNVIYKSGKDDLLEKDMELDDSIYETPYNARRAIKSNEELFNCSNTSLSQEEANLNNGCNKALSFITPCKAFVVNNPVPVSDSASGCARNNSFCCASIVSSPLDISAYATPYCSHVEKRLIPKCLSLQQISVQEAENPLKENIFVSEQKDRVSKSMEGFKTQEICDTHETCSDASRVVDSGYPDSYSEHNMELDLTPEQFDDIETESEGNDVSSCSLSPPLPPPVLQALRMVDDVQNGDVANNNRDGEGNNVVADMEEEPLEFEAQIEEVYNELPNLAAVDYTVKQGLQECHDSPNLPGTFQEECGNSLLLQKLKNDDFSENKMLEQKNKTSLETLIDKNTESHSSITTDSSWDHLDTPVFNNISYRGINESDDPQDAGCLKGHTSLTTVMDGCSKCPNCLLVQPVEINDSTIATTENNGLEGRILESKTLVNELETRDFLEVLSKDALEIDSFSIDSEYESVVSLQNENYSSFPDWLLDLNIMDEEDEDEVPSLTSVMTVWDDESHLDLGSLNFDVQTDVRGGGDHQSNESN